MSGPAELQDPAPGAADEAGSLDHLIARAENIDAGRKPDADPLPVGEVTPSNTAAELRGALEIVRSIATPMMSWWPEFSATWSDQALEAIAASGGAVMDRHGWSVGGVMGQWGPYIGLAAALGPPSFVTWQAIKARQHEPGKEGAHVGAQQAAN